MELDIAFPSPTGIKRLLAKFAPVEKGIHFHSRKGCILWIFRSAEEKVTELHNLLINMIMNIMCLTSLRFRMRNMTGL